MNPVQRPLENVFKHPPIIIDLAVVGQDQNHTVLDVAIRMIWRLEEPVCFGTKVRVRLSVN